MIKGNKYKHYKGGYYTIICKCMLESDLTEMVVYKCDKSTITKHAREIGYDYSFNKEIKITNVPIETIIK